MTQLEQPRPNEERKGMRGMLGLVLRIVLGVGLLMWILLKVDRWWILLELSSRPWILAFVSLVPFVTATLEALRLCTLSSARGMKISFGRSYWLVVVGFFFNQFLPGGSGGDLMKVYYLASDDLGRATDAAAVVLVDRVAGLYSLILLIAALGLVNGTPLMEQPMIMGLASLAAAAALAIPLVAFTAHRWWKPTGSFQARLGKWPFGSYLVSFADAVLSFRHHGGRLALAVLISVGAQLIVCLVFVVLAGGAMVAVPARSIGLLALLGYLANVLPVTPAGLGVGESVFEALFRLARHAGGAQLMLAWRLGTLPLALAGGVLFSRRTAKVHDTTGNK